MSLLITSNETNDGGNAPVNVGINRPYDYINNFSQPLNIPANSKIAVQSVKINKEGGIQINQANAQFGLYFGDKTLNADGTIPMKIYTETVKYTRLNYWGNKNQIFTIDEFAKQLELACNNGTFNPALQKSALTGGGATVSVLRNATSNDFEGYTTTFTQSNNASLTNRVSEMNFVDVGTNAVTTGGTWNGGAGTITHDNTTIPGVTAMVGAGGPISNQEGIFTASFKDAGAKWCIGLSRYQDVDVDLPHLAMPPYFYKPGSGGVLYDYMVCSQLNSTDNKWYLRVYDCGVIDPDAGEIGLNEFEYWDYGIPATTGALTGPIETFTESASYTVAKISKVSFKISNEKIVLDITSDDDTSASYTLANGAQAGKQDNLKPTCATTKYLYPKVSLGVGGNETTPKAFITIETANIDPPDGFVYGDKRNDAGAYPDRGNVIPNDHDWWCKLYWTGGMDEYGVGIDNRYMMDPNDTTGGPAGDGVYTQHGINASGGLFGDFKLVVQDAESMGWKPSAQLNAGELLGYGTFSTVNASTSDNLVQTFESTCVPAMVSTNSLFVRLNNFTQTSFNCMTGSPSKILYHLPRFTNSGEEFGGLFFEPSEKVYVALNNPSPLVINDLSISIVNVNETLANNLTGKTVVCFHIIS